MPKVSVIIPTHNRPDILSQAIKSVFNQTFQDFEIIVIDDGLIARAEEIVKSFNDSRIFYYQNKTSLGAAASRNRGASLARGQLLAFLDDDDSWIDRKLEKQISLLSNSSSDVGFCFSGVINCSEKGKFNTEVFAGTNDYHLISLTRFKGFLTSTLIIKKKAFEEINGFDENFPSHQEAELIIRLTQKYKGIGLNEPLVIMNNFSTDEHIGGNLERRIRGREMLIKKHFQEYLLHPILLAKQYFWLGLMYRQNGKFSLAADYFVKAWRQDKKIRYTFHFLWAKIRESKQKILQSKFFRPIHFGTLLRLKYFNRFLILNKKNNNFKNILDAGCGHGKYSKLLADYYPSASVLGIDILEDEEWGNYPNKNLCFKVFDLKNFREQNIYDLIVSIDTLEHIVDNKKVITNLIEALRPSGLIYLAIPCDKTSIHIFPRRWFQRFHDWESDEHLGEQPVLDELKQEMKERNLEILVSRHTFTFWGTLGWEFEFLLRGKKLGDRLNIILMPFYNLLCFLDIWLPIGRGNNLILARKK